MPSITLLTDFGLADTYVGQMKGVMAGIVPEAVVVDLTHAVPAQAVAVGAVMLESAVEAFEPGTIHVAVVDPGVGSARQGVAVRTGQGVFVGPDNGLFTAVLERWPAIEAVVLTNRQYQRAVVSATFHGRDVFAPAAAHLAAGVPLAELGEAVDAASLVRLTLPRPRPVDGGLEGHVLWVDHYGNLVTNLRTADLPAEGAERVVLVVNGGRVRGVSRTFSDVSEGQPVAYWGSSGRLEIAVRNGSAAERLGMSAGSVVRVEVVGESGATPRYSSA